MNFTLPQMTSTLKTTFATLRYPNYRAYLIGFMISVCGLWAHLTAAGYLVYDLTGSATYLGYFGFAQGFAFILLALLSGVIADRVPRRKMLIFTQFGMMIEATVLTVLTFSGAVQAWQVIGLTFILGIVRALDSPNRLAFISELVEPEDLSNAIPLHSTFLNSAAIIGPIIAGFLYTLVGPGWVFLFDALTYVAFLIPLIRMRTTHEQDHLQKHHSAAFHEMKDGIRYAFSNNIIRLLLLSLLLYNIFGLSVRNLTPAWASNVLLGGAQTNSWLLAGVGVGAVIAALVIASMSYKRVRGKLRLFGGFAYATSLITLFLFRWQSISILMFVLMGTASMMIANNTLGIIQTCVSEEVRGRVSGIFTMMFMGGSTIGSLLVGYLADNIGETHTVLICGLVLLTLTLYLMFNKRELVSLG